MAGDTQITPVSTRTLAAEDGAGDSEDSFALCRISSTRSTISTSVLVKGARDDNAVPCFVSCEVHMLSYDLISRKS